MFWIIVLVLVFGWLITGLAWMGWTGLILAVAIAAAYILMWYRPSWRRRKHA